jgi:SAM-dependent methyltransferase
VSEFTGERVIPNEVNSDLWAEHLSRYAFASRYAAGKHALDIGCGTGYGTAELAKHATAAVGIDVATDALDYARAHYPNVRFDKAEATALPFPDQSFDLITAFEVIEHLNDWRALLSEARRVLRSGGIFFVSTPNKSYYAESRAQDGPNPFHEHEFEFDEFNVALAEFFPHVAILQQNWQQAIAFALPETERDSDVRIESGATSAAEANFFLAICSIDANLNPHNFLYLPSASNLLREREHHIQSLERELASARAERDAMIDQTAIQKSDLEQSNRWATQLDADWKAALVRVAQVQNELSAAQTRATEVAADYARKVADLEQDNREKTAWALETERRLSAELSAKCDELFEAVQFLERSEKTVVERTEWAQRTQAQVDQLQAELRMIRDSRWIKIGRTVGLGPRVTD